jgi:phage terminase small subunit
MLAHELGLSPAARAKMPKVEKKKTGNPFEDL